MVSQKSNKYIIVEKYKWWKTAHYKVLNKKYKIQFCRNQAEKVISSQLSSCEVVHHNHLSNGQLDELKVSWFGRYIFKSWLICWLIVIHHNQLSNGQLHNWRFVLLDNDQNCDNPPQPPFKWMNLKWVAFDFLDDNDSLEIVIIQYNKLSNGKPDELKLNWFGQLIEVMIHID